MKNITDVSRVQSLKFAFLNNDSLIVGSHYVLVI